MRSLLAVLAILVVVLVGCGDDDDAESGDDSDAAAVIEAYVAAYNSGDIDAVVAVFSEDAVITQGSETSTGLTEIETLQIDDMSSAAEADAYSITNVETDGDTVTWDHVWTNDAGVDWCAEGQSAVVTDGKIVTWTWPLDTNPCE
jgi:hypothetical protein